MTFDIFHSRHFMLHIHTYIHIHTSICKLFELLRRTYLIYKCLSINCIAKSMGLTQRWHEKGLNDRNTWHIEFIFLMKTILMKWLYAVRFKTVENHDSNSLAVKLVCPPGNSCLWWGFFLCLMIFLVSYIKLLSHYWIVCVFFQI